MVRHQGSLRAGTALFAVLVPVLVPVLGLVDAATADVVLRRGASPMLTGRIVTVDDAGVTVDTDPGARVLVPWDRVLEVRTDRPHQGLAGRLQRAERLWRARSRVERGDTVLAEPLLAALFETSRGRTDETALVVAEGLLRCRVARGDAPGAVVPALETMRLRRRGVETGSYAMLTPVLDADSGLCFGAPPAWSGPEGLAALERELAAYRAPDDVLVARAARLYRRAARHGLDLDDDPGPPATGDLDDDRDLVLLRLLVDAGAKDAGVRADAATAATARLDAGAGPAEAWLRFAAGSALLGDDDPARRRRGLVHLLHLPARFLRGHPYLAGLALRRAADAYAAAGDETSAAALRRDLAQRLPAHPARSAGSPNEDEA